MLSFGNISLTIAVGCCVFFLSLATTTEASSFAADDDDLDLPTPPWQEANGDAMRASIIEEQLYMQLPPITFSATGRLHQVEAAVEASRRNHPMVNLVVAMVCNGGDDLVVVTTCPLSPHLNHQQNTTNLLLLDQTPSPLRSLSTNNLWCATGGNAVDSQVLRERIFSVTGALSAATGGEEEVSPSEIARKLADHLQKPTQTMGGDSGGLLASSALIVGNNELWTVDPNGQFWNCHVAVLGRKAGETQEAIYERIITCKKNQSNSNNNTMDVEEYCHSLSTDDALELACECIQQVLFPEKALSANPEAAAKLPKVPWHGVVMKKKASSSNNSDDLDPTSRIATTITTTKRGFFVPFGAKR